MKPVLWHRRAFEGSLFRATVGAQDAGHGEHADEAKQVGTRHHRQQRPLVDAGLGPIRRADAV